MSEQLADIAARWRDVAWYLARRLHGQQARKAAGGTVEKDGWHWS